MLQERRWNYNKCGIRRSLLPRCHAKDGGTACRSTTASATTTGQIEGLLFCCNTMTSVNILGWECTNRQHSKGCAMCCTNLWCYLVVSSIHSCRREWPLKWESFLTYRYTMDLNYMLCFTDPIHSYSNNKITYYI